MGREPPEDAMVIVAALVSRVEALVVASMLEAAGVQVTVGANCHASVAVNSLALGGHRLWVPASQHYFASSVLREVLGEEEWAFCRGLQRAVWRLLAVWTSLQTVLTVFGVWVGGISASTLLLVPLSCLTVPVNPQGRGDYFLASRDDYPAA